MDSKSKRNCPADNDISEAARNAQEKGARTPVAAVHVLIVSVALAVLFDACLEQPHSLPVPLEFHFELLEYCKKGMGNKSSWQSRFINQETYG